MIETSSRTSDAVLANRDAKIRISYDINASTEFLDWLSQANGLSIKDIVLNSNLSEQNRAVFLAARGFGRRLRRSTNPRSRSTRVRTGGTKNPQKTYGNRTP
jgi:hypothetical protein